MGFGNGIAPSRRHAIGKRNDEGDQWRIIASPATPALADTLLQGLLKGQGGKGNRPPLGMKIDD